MTRTSSDRGYTDSFVILQNPVFSPAKSGRTGSQLSMKRDSTPKLPFTVDANLSNVEP